MNCIVAAINNRSGYLFYPIKHLHFRYLSIPSNWFQFLDCITSYDYNEIISSIALVQQFADQRRRSILRFNASDGLPTVIAQKRVTSYPGR